MSLLRLRRSRLTKALFFFLTFLLLGGGPARAGVVPLTPGIDNRAIQVDITGSPVGTVGNPLFASITGGGSGGTSAVDESVWTAAVNSFNPGGGVFNDSAAALASGQAGELRVTPNRAQHVNLRNQAGTEMGTNANPLSVSVVGGGSATSVSAADEAAWTAGVTLFNPGGGVFNDSAAALTTGQQGTGRLTPNRAVHTNLRNQAGTEVGTAGAPLRIDPTGGTPQPVTGTFFQATQPVSGTVTANQGTQNAAGAASWNVQGAAGSGGVLANPVIVGGQNAGVVKYMSLDANGGVNQGGQNAGGAVSWNVQGAASDNTALAGSPLRLGASDATNIQTLRQATATTGTTGTGLLGAAPQGLAVAVGTAPSTVTAGQYVSQVATRGGIPFSIGGHPNIVTVRANFTTAQTNTVVVANTAGTKLVVTGYMIDADNANSVNTQVRIGLAQTTTPTTTGVFASHPGVAAGSGIARGNGGGILAIGADGDQILLTSGVPTGGSIDVLVEYFATPS